jgi:hypothetical protein
MKKVMIYVLVTVLLVVVSSVFYNHNNPPHRARTYVDGWRNMGMYLPKDQIPFFAEHFSGVKDIIAQAMTHSESQIRQRAAYVIEGLGHQAKSLETDIFKSLQVESDCTVRLYFYDALRSIGANSQQSLSYLKDRYEFLSQQEDDPSDGQFYKASDERIKVAATLFVLDDEIQRRPEYLNEVLKWLKPPKTLISTSELEAYWDHRWLAVNSLEFMNGAEEAIPFLEKMLDEQPTKQWVSVHVPRVLKSLRNKSGIE